MWCQQKLETGMEFQNKRNHHTDSYTSRSASTAFHYTSGVHESRSQTGQEPCSVTCTCEARMPGMHACTQCTAGTMSNCTGIWLLQQLTWLGSRCSMRAGTDLQRGRPPGPWPAGSSRPPARPWPPALLQPLPSWPGREAARLWRALLPERQAGSPPCLTGGWCM